MTVAIDSSALIAYLSGSTNAAAEQVDKTLEGKLGVLPPVVLTEILSEPTLKPKIAEFIQRIPVLLIELGFWERAAATRKRLLAKGLRARLADTLIAQSCIDHGVPLITCDQDFRHFEKYAGSVVL